MKRIFWEVRIVSWKKIFGINFVDGFRKSKPYSLIDQETDSDYATLCRRFELLLSNIHFVEQIHYCWRWSSWKNICTVQQIARNAPRNFCTRERHRCWRNINSMAQKTRIQYVPNRAHKIIKYKIIQAILSWKMYMLDENLENQLMESEKQDSNAQCMPAICT